MTKTPTPITLTLIFSHKQFHKHLPYILHSRLLATTNHDSSITPLPAKPLPRCSSGDLGEGASASYVSSGESHRRARSPARRPHLRPREALAAAGDPPPDDEAPSKRDDREELRTCAGGNVAGEHRQRFDQGGRRDLREGEEKAFGEGDRSAPFRASLLAVQLGE